MDHRPNRIGMKAESLVAMLGGGFRVPDGFVVCVGETADGIEKFADEDIEYAVRSSGLCEDLPGVSFAGQYDSYLHVKGFDNLKKAIADCQQSIHSPRVQAYVTMQGIDASSSAMAVIVQKMVNADCAGVAFSVNPINGKDTEMLIEAVEGTGEKLVSGLVTPESYAYNWYDETSHDFSHLILSYDKMNELCDIVLSIQEFYGFPVDVEWAIQNDEIYILQSRPITAISYQGIPEEWTTADFRDGGVSASCCKTLMASLYGLVFHDSFLSSVKTIKLLKDSDQPSIYKVFYGRPFWMLSLEKELFAKLPGFVEREIDADMGIVPSYEGDGRVTRTTPQSILQALRVLYAVNAHLKRMQRSAKSKKEKILLGFAKYEELDLSQYSASRLHDLWKEFVFEHYYFSEYTYFQYIFCNMILSTLLKDKFKKHLSEHEITGLYMGLSDLSHMRPIYDAWALSRTKMSERDFAAYLQTYKHHSLHELDISYPNWDEMPEVARSLIKDFTREEDDQNPKRLCDIQRSKYEELYHKLPRKLQKDVLRLRDFLWWREEFRDVSSKSYYIMRRLTLALGKKWVDLGKLQSEEDIFFLSVEDIKRGDQLLTPAVKNKRYYNSFFHYDCPGEIGNRHARRMNKKPAPGSLCGVPCSGVYAKGRARVIADIHDAHRLQKGDILVTRCTDPSWTAVFGKLGGVITQTGGMLSHAAVVSREYGIACILVVKDATKVIKDGDIVIMDCNTGEITIEK
jgi:pyruvate,water dikinase